MIHQGIRRKKYIHIYFYPFEVLQCKINPQCVKSEAYMRTCFSLGGNFQNMGAKSKMF